MIEDPSPLFPLGRLQVEFYDNGRKFVTVRRFRYVDPVYDIDVTIEPWTVTDLNSTPRPVWWFFAPTEYPIAGGVHDELFRRPPVGWSRANCDFVHWRLLRLLGCPEWKAEMVFQILSKFSGAAWNKCRDAERKPAILASGEAIIPLRQLRSLMSDTPIADAIAAIDKRPRDTVRIEAAATKDDQGASIGAHRDFGNPGGWSAGTEASWYRKAGWKVAAVIEWVKGK